jgi:hypothetical protein
MVDITPAIKYLNKCHSGEGQNPGKQPGCRIKSGMTSVSYFIARLILSFILTSFVSYIVLSDSPYYNYYG